MRACGVAEIGGAAALLFAVASPPADLTHAGFQFD